MATKIGHREEEILTNLVQGKELQSILRKRRSQFVFQTVKIGTEDLYIEDGWEEVKRKRKSKKSTRLRKDKPQDEALEDEVWCLFAKMGFLEMNADRNFKIPVTGGPHEIPPKQIDVFAIDEETVIFVECKSAESIKKKSFQKDINELVGLKRKLMNSVIKHFNPENKLKAAWIFATRNYIWSNNDLERAKDESITVLSDDDLDYFNELVDHLGPAAKYQLLAELFGKTEIPGLNTTVPAVKGEMGGTTYYTFVIEPERLLKTAFICHRSSMDKNTIVTYQRMLKKNRLKGIKEYIEEDGLFPTNIVLNIVTDKQKSLRFDQASPKDDLGAKFGTLTLPNKYKSAWIIDGQHRLYGFSGSSYSDKVKLPVIAFENMSGSDQAKMFVDINSKQVRVSTNLLTELYSDLLWDSEREDEKLLALISRLVLQLDRDLESPLKDKIIYSGKKRNKTRPITNTTLNTAIGKTTHLLGNVSKGSNQLYPGPLYDKDMKTSLNRSKTVLSAYLNEFKNTMYDHWELGPGPGGYICTNNGISTLIIVLKNILDHIDKTSSIKSHDYPTDELIDEIMPFTKALTKSFAKLSPDEIKRYRDQLGVHGQKQAAYGMMEIINQVHDDFEPHGLIDYLASKSSEYSEKARLLVPELQLMIRGHIISVLKTEFGEDIEDEAGWWYKGIPGQVRTTAGAQVEQDPEHKPKDQQFTLINYKDITIKNWNLLKDTLSPNPNMSKAKGLAWFDELNKIRNKISHPERGQVSEEEFKFLEELDERLKVKIT